MNGDQSTKQFTPTQSRLQKARREGDVPRSAELSGAVAFASALCALVFVLSHISGAARAEFVSAAAQPFSAEPAGILIVVGWSLVPAVCAAIGGVAAALLQGGGLSLTPLSLKIERLNPLEGIKRMLSREALIASARALLAVACAAAVLLPAAWRLFPAAKSSSGIEALAGATVASALTGGFVIAATGGLFGCADFALVHLKWKKRLRMSFDELKREQKEQDGDPAAKGRRRSLHRELSRASIRRLRDAAFVVVNPTHVAVAIAYQPPEISVPRVLLRAADESALRVRKAAAGLRIPVVENVPLARTLYAGARPGEFIPKESYLAVAEIVAALVRTGALE